MKTLKLMSKGPLVELVQSTLKSIGYYDSKISNLFDLKTENSVKNFQSQFGLSVDGIVGTDTWIQLLPYINGYTYYIVQNNDTLYSIANAFDTTINRIKIANPNIRNENFIRSGIKLLIPFNNIVSTDISYSYDIMMLNLEALLKTYPFLKSENSGFSVMGKDLPVIKIGKGSNTVFYSASYHANEWITSPLLMKFIEDYSKALTENINFIGYNINDLYANSTIYIMPMVNPDGVDLVTGALDSSNISYLNAKDISNNYPNIPFPDGWKANISGIDLNLQFPADWEQSKEIKYSQGFTSPAPRDFVGYEPLSEPESLAVFNFTKKHDFRLILAYHTQGEVIFWKFKSFDPPDSEYIGEILSNISGYPLLDTPYNSSFAGYKDWFILNYNKPGYTIEAGLGVNPLPIEQFDKIYSDNIGILFSAAQL